MPGAAGDGDGMTYLDHLPDDIARLIRTRFIAEFGTLSKAGIAIDTPLVPFTSEDLETIDSTTGLAYPAKADRVRSNPKVGMLFEGEAQEPVVSIAGMAAVRDRDFQANLDRYLCEEILTPAISPQIVDYQSVTRPAIWYFTRIIIEVKPVHVRWWKNRAAMDAPPAEWRRPSGAAYPLSDPAPSGDPSKALWERPVWRDLARNALARKVPAHLCLTDAEGFPLPIRIKEVHAHEDGFRLVLPKWLPWSGGKGTVSFQGLEIFIGETSIVNSEALFRIDRALPVHPLLAGGPLTPDQATKEGLLGRIRHELDRRGGLPFPEMPAQPPQPTAGARLRAEDAFAFSGINAAHQ